MRFWDRIEHRGKVFLPIDVFWEPYKTDEKGRIVEEARWINPFESLKAEFKEVSFEDFMRIVVENNLLIARYYSKEQGEVYLFPLKKGGIQPKELFFQSDTLVYTKKKV